MTWECKATHALRHHFGHSHLKCFQKEALKEWAHGRDCFVLAASGSGNRLSYRNISHCYLGEGWPRTPPKPGLRNLHHCEMTPLLDDFPVVLKYSWISCCRQVFVLSTTSIDHRKSSGGHLSIDQSHARPVLTIGSRRSCCMFPWFRPEGSNCRTESNVW